MDPNTVAAVSAMGAVVAAVVAFVALFYTARAANAAAQQTKIQREMAKAAAQPYVWADIRPDTGQGGLLTLVVGNSGPTIATDVRISFDPALDMPFEDETQHAVQILARGLPSLPPGRNWQWNLGSAGQIVGDDSPRTYEIEVRANGPFGEVEPITYAVNIDDLKQTRVAPDGNLHLVAQAMSETNNALTKIADAVAAVNRTAPSQRTP